MSTPTDLIGVGYLNGTYKDYIDMESFEAIRAELSEAFYNEFEFNFYEPLTDPFAFIQEQIFKSCSIFPFITNDGRLGLKRHVQPTQTNDLLVFDKDNVIEFTEKKNSMEKYVNHIKIDYNNIKDQNKDRFNRTFYAIQPEALTKTGFLFPKGQPLTFQFEGINFGGTQPVNQEIIVQAVVDAYFNRYSTSITNIGLTTTCDVTRELKVGDYVGVLHDFLIEWSGDNAGNRGLEEDTPDDPNDTAIYNVGDVWAGFIKDNHLGTGWDGYVFLDTQQEEIKSELLTGATESCATNHQLFQDWMAFQS